MTMSNIKYKVYIDLWTGSIDILVMMAVVVWGCMVLNLTGSVGTLMTLHDTTLTPVTSAK